jgi:hypothetical protein
VQLVKIAVEALLASDLEELHWGRQGAYATWYAGPLSKKDKPEKPSRKGQGTRPRTKAAAERFDPNAHLADEIATEAELLDGQDLDERTGDQSPAAALEPLV